MPTADNKETVAERLVRLRAEWTRVCATIERAEINGQSFGMLGSTITQIAYERAVRRRRELETEIRRLEDRSAGKRVRTNLAHVVTRIP